MYDYNRQSQEEEQLLYNHWLELVQVEQPIEPLANLPQQASSHPGINRFV
ncbi:MAG: hypothetical protein ACMG55_07135 [Microcoleus sp.]